MLRQDVNKQYSHASKKKAPGKPQNSGGINDMVEDKNIKSISTSAEFLNTK